MNGYSESDAQWGLLLFIFLAFAISIAASAAAYFLTGRFLRRGYQSVAAAAIGIPLAVVGGCALQAGAAIGAVLVTEFARTSL